MHSITGRLNKNARQHQSEKGTTFFVSLGESNYNYQTRQKEWTNYEAALFAKGNQVDFYNNILVEGSVITVNGLGIIVQNEEQYGVKLILRDAKLVWASNDAQRQQNHSAGMQQARNAVQGNQQQSNAIDDLDDGRDIPF
jgi:single-strand DNA-binding protein